MKFAEKVETLFLEGHSFTKVFHLVLFQVKIWRGCGWMKLDLPGAKVTSEMRMARLSKRVSQQHQKHSSQCASMYYHLRPPFALSNLD